MAKILRSLAGESYTYDGAALGAYDTVTKSGQSVTEDEAYGVTLRRIQLDLVVDESDGDVAIAFPALTDTPDNYTASGNKFVKVKTGADGLEFCQTVTETAGTALDIATSTGLSLSDDGDNGVSMSSSGAGGVNLNAEGEDAAIYLNSDNALDVQVGSLVINQQTAVATQSVLVAGVGTMVFTHGILTGFTPA